MSKIRVSGLVAESIVDGPGIRYVVFAQGCVHNCKGCHNPATHALDGGRLVEVDDIVSAIKKNPLLKGVTFSGGEPFLQAEAFTELAQKCHELGLDVICYTGYTFEKLVSSFEVHPEWEALLKNIDTLIDGPFVEEKKSLMLLFRGSSNQRMLDMVSSLKQMCPVAVEA